MTDRVQIHSVPMTEAELLALSALFWGPLLGHEKESLQVHRQVFQGVWDRAQPLLAHPKTTLEQALASIPIHALNDNGECDFLEFGFEIFEDGKRVPVKSERGQELVKIADIIKAESQ